MFGVRALILGLALGCGAENNFNKIFVGEDDEERVDALLIKSRAYFDRGDLRLAEQLAKKAVERAPDDDGAALQLAQVYLAKAGITPLGMARKMIESNKGTTTTPGTALTTSATSTLASLSDLLSITKTDFDGLATNRVPTSDLIKAYDVYVPKPLTGFNTDGSFAADSPRSVVPTLRNINLAIKAICPFVSPALITTYGDAVRHERVCGARDGRRTKSASVHFTFALAHLLESIVFNILLMYESSFFTLAGTTAASASTTNLFNQASTLQKTEISVNNIGDFVTAVGEVQTNITDVFASDGTSDARGTSMLTATLIDVRLAVNAFKEIPGIPDEVTKGLNGALSAIEEAAKEVGGAGDELDAQVAEFKKQLNGQVSEKISSTITQALDEQADTLTTQQREELCTALGEVDAETAKTACAT